MEATVTTENQKPPLMTTAEVAKLSRSSREKVRQQAESGELPAIRDGRHWKYPRAKIYEHFGLEDT